MTRELLIQNARVIDPVNELDEVRDIGVRDGLIVPPQSLSSTAAKLDLTGKIAAPGFIDIHVHLRDPGQLHKETIETGTAAAAAGGFTTVMAMPNTVPPVDSPAAVDGLIRRFRTEALVHVLQSACLTVDRTGTVLTDFGALKKAGAAALTDDGSTIQNNALMLEAMRRAKELGLVVVDHCEDSSLAAGGVMNEGDIAEQLGLPAQNPAAEDSIVARNIVLANQTRCPVHLQHLSTRFAVQLLRFARRRGIPVTGEVCPHHLFLDESACAEYGTNAKMNPPLRTNTDRQALIQGLQENTITVIATDHAPHSEEEKSLPFGRAPFGIVGMETAVALCLTNLYHTGLLPLPDLIAKFTAGPRAVLNLSCGTLTPGAAADITVLDVDAEHQIDVSRFQSKSRNCPYDGWSCKGKVVGTMVAGNWVLLNL